MGYRSIVTVYEHNGWRLVSYGNGAAYTLHDDQHKRSVFFQGDDAEIFRSRIMNEAGWLNDYCEECFADYIDIMQPDEDH